MATITMQANDLAWYYKFNGIFYYCDGRGVVHLPGDLLGTSPWHSLDDLPPKARELYEKAWGKFQGGIMCVAGVAGKIGMLYSWVLDHEWFQSQFPSEPWEKIRKELHSAVQDMANAIAGMGIETFYGFQTDNAGDQLALFFTYEQEIADHQNVLNIVGLVSENLIDEILNKIRAKLVKQPDATLYQRVVERKVPKEDIDHHETDLYLRVTPLVNQILGEFFLDNELPEIFMSKVAPEGPWYSIPFAYEPFFEEVLSCG